MFDATRMSVNIDIVPLLQGRVSISSAQLFGMRANLYKENATAKPNFQFVIDALASKDTTEAKKPLDIRIGSIIIRHGSVNWDRHDIPSKYKTFSVNHLHVSDLSAHLMLNTLKEDTVDLNVKRFSLREASGLNVKDLSFRFTANKKEALLADFHLRLPNTEVYLGDIRASYSFDKDKFLMPSLQYEGGVLPSSVTLADLQCFVPELKTFRSRINLHSNFSGTSTSLRVKNISVNTENGGITLMAEGSATNVDSGVRWYANVRNLHLSANEIEKFAQNFGARLKMPNEVLRLGNIKYVGGIGGSGRNIAVRGVLDTDAGGASLYMGKSGNRIQGHFQTNGIMLGKILADNHFGILSAKLNINGMVGTKLPDIKVDGLVSRIDYNNYSYRNISVNGSYIKGIAQGKLDIDDIYAKLQVQGLLNTQNPKVKMQLNVARLNPFALGLVKMWSGTTFSFNADADFSGRKIDTSNGLLRISDFRSVRQDEEYSLDSLSVRAGYNKGIHYLLMNSDFGKVYLTGRYDYSTLAQSFINLIGSKLPTIPGLPRMRRTDNNNFNIDATIAKTDWLNHLFNVPLNLDQPLRLHGSFSDVAGKTNITASVPEFSYGKSRFSNFYFNISSPNDTLYADARITTSAQGDRRGTTLQLHSSAAGNRLFTQLGFNNHKTPLLRGEVQLVSQFKKDREGRSTAYVSFLPSDIMVGDTVWSVQPSNVVYRQNHIDVNNFSIKHGEQHLYISGLATKSENDALNVDFKDLDVEYILDLINFKSVSFGGHITGHGSISSVFTKPQADADVKVENFTFQKGHLGVLTANVGWNPHEKQIDIKAIANEGENKYTLVNGYVSPSRNYIDLDINANGTNAAFLQSMCGFMDNVNLRCNGDVHLVGDLSHDINLMGTLVANGSLRIKPLNTVYTLMNDSIVCSYHNIALQRDSVYDRNGNLGIVNGNIRHDNLARMKYNINIDANNLLAFDTHSFGDNTYYGTAYVDGTCRIQGRSGEINMDIEATPCKGSQFVYNVPGSNAMLSNNDFIHWSVRKDSASADINNVRIPRPEIDIPSDMHINFLINSTPDLTLKLIMDNQTGDYISLNGNGVLRASYYNKGAFDIYGNYNVMYGVYKLTIQNIIKKDFRFMNGGTIAFGGDPYNAALNLQASYTVNGVSLADLKIGNSFANSNIRVNCLMNISGMPRAPKVDFSLDMPNVNNDVKQMVMNLMNSEEEISQQVVYLLAVGRFYTQGSNNSQIEDAQQQSQTSLAMQSLLSGTLSQQLNSVLSTVINNSNWNFGANISTGTEGFNNAEYEGLLSGRMLNNRLLFSGQFGYRDNANATTSFIGDFDLRYLLRPNGNLSINVYNKTNDRYFTKNSMNTQGIGLIIKKDFVNLRDLFGRKRKQVKADKK